MFNAFMYANLKHVSDFSEGTALCLYEPTRKLYIVKRVPNTYREYYEKIASIDNPHLAKILYIDNAEDAIFIVREYISGDSLHCLLREKKTLPEAQAIKIISQVCEGLSELHSRGLVHRDINPNNILVTSEGNAVIIDYGIVRSFAKEKSSDTVILGTPGYAAPEQFGFSQSDHRTDIYAAGVLLNVMLTGKLPNEMMYDGFYGEIIKKCVLIDPNLRYYNTNDLCNALQNKNRDTGTVDNFIKQIPGLRSKKTSTVVFSIIGYVFFVIFLCIDFKSITPKFENYLKAIIYWTLLVPIPLFCFGNMGDVWNKLPFTKGAAKRSQCIIYYTLGAISIFLGMIVFGL